jgi:hypothetical protein
MFAVICIVTLPCCSAGGRIYSRGGQSKRNSPAERCNALRELFGRELNLSPRSRDVVEKLTVAQLLMKFPAEGKQLLCSRDPVLSEMSPVHNLTSHLF